MAEFQDLLNMGYSEYTIAAKLGISLEEVSRRMGRKPPTNKEPEPRVERSGWAYTKEELERVAAMLAAGESVRDVCEATGIHRSVLYKKFKGSFRRRATTEDIEGARDLIQRGQSAQDIAYALKMSLKTAQRLVKKIKEEDREALWDKLHESLVAGGADKATIKQARKQFLGERE